MAPLSGKTAYDNQRNLHLRLYKPRSTPAAALPILYFCHGGGCPTTTLAASALQVMVVAPDYRLALEHRLPIVVEDVLSSLKWLQQQALLADGGGDEWLRKGIDFGRVFVVGDSSGGNLAHRGGRTDCGGLYGVSVV
ncbi:probable carboxylesterase 15 [Salvia miltiorrhiza]|uniref:probable carboxylesterase 15 n=1 Tax=Salvia miltiorrhiza TaxID=226208 RepID=UPI0025ACC1B3|nr:probable carboxylesterase 15 [Salvia miltiorrhiza]